MTSRGRKGNDLANLFDGLTTCAYCGSEVRFLSSHPYKSLVCAKVIDENGCTRTAWSYQDFEANVLQFLAHPALLDAAELSRKDELRNLVGDIVRLGDDGDLYVARYSIALSLRKIVTQLTLSSSGAIPWNRLGYAAVRRDVKGRFFELRLWGGALYRGI